jgi:predicted 3-demethylubiquinone-9 3-methyltransferase (glyoxalase superfamily)
MKGITPMLWFDKQAEEAARFYVSVFPNSKIVRIAHYPESAESVSGQAKGSVMTVEFELNGQPFVALNAGPVFKFSEAISFVVNCESQEEIDSYWQKLLAGGGQESDCGWLKDRYGLSWQITPTELFDMNADPDRVKADRVMAAMLKMKKLDLPALRKAFEGA